MRSPARSRSASARASSSAAAARPAAEFQARQLVAELGRPGPLGSAFSAADQVSRAASALPASRSAVPRISAKYALSAASFDSAISRSSPLMASAYCPPCIAATTGPGTTGATGPIARLDVAAGPSAPRRAAEIPISTQVAGARAARPVGVVTADRSSEVTPAAPAPARPTRSDSIVGRRCDRSVPGKPGEAPPAARPGGRRPVAGDGTPSLSVAARPAGAQGRGIDPIARRRPCDNVRRRPNLGAESIPGRRAARAGSAREGGPGRETAPRAVADDRSRGVASPRPAAARAARPDAFGRPSPPRGRRPAAGIGRDGPGPRRRSTRSSTKVPPSPRWSAARRRRPRAPGDGAGCPDGPAGSRRLPRDGGSARGRSSRQVSILAKSDQL